MRDVAKTLVLKSRHCWHTNRPAQTMKGRKLKSMIQGYGFIGVFSHWQEVKTLKNNAGQRKKKITSRNCVYVLPDVNRQHHISSAEPGSNYGK